MVPKVSVVKPGSITRTRRFKRLRRVKVHGQFDFKGVVELEKDFLMLEGCMDTTCSKIVQQRIWSRVQGLSEFYAVSRNS